MSLYLQLRVVLWCACLFFSSRSFLSLLLFLVSLSSSLCVIHFSVGLVVSSSRCASELLFLAELTQAGARRTPPCSSSSSSLRQGGGGGGGGERGSRSVEIPLVALWSFRNFCDVSYLLHDYYKPLLVLLNGRAGTHPPHTRLLRPRRRSLFFLLRRPRLLFLPPLCSTPSSLSFPAFFSSSLRV